MPGLPSRTSIAITIEVLQGDELAPFLFIIVLDYVSKRSAGDWPTKETLKTIVEEQLKVQIVQLTTKSTTLHSPTIWLYSKTIQYMPSEKQDSVDHLVINDQPINIADDFKYLGSNVGSTEHVQICIGLALTAFSKLKSIIRSPKPKLNLKIRLFIAAFLSILFYGYDTWILTEAFTEKLDIFAITCYRVMLGIKQSRVHVTNERLYQRVNQVPISNDHLFDQESKQGHIDNKVRLTFYPARNRSKQLKYGR